MSKYDVIIIGGGPSGLSAGVFTSRADLDTLIIEHGTSILKRNAHLENYLGFPAGVNSRLLLKMGIDQARRNGCTYKKNLVENVREREEKFIINTENGEEISTKYLIVASWADTSYLRNLEIETFDEGSKTFISTDKKGRSSIEGIYAAGRIAHEYHQTIVSAGHGAKVALTLIEDDNPDFYHDWVAPEGYFTNRGREVPEGCEEIDTEERKRREEKSIKIMREYFSSAHDQDPVPHPSLSDKE